MQPDAMRPRTPAPSASPVADALDVLIVDDEPLARLRLRGLLQALADPAVRVVGEAGDGHGALELLRTQRCDAILLDIRMPGLDGLALAARLRTLPATPAVIFVTAFGDHALEAFEVQAIDYLTKPVQRERLAGALRRVPRRLAVPASAAAVTEAADAVQGLLVVAERTRTLRIPLQEIVLARAEHKRVVLHTLTRHYRLDLSLNDLAARLGAGFCRVHRNAVVARRAVRELQRRPDGDDDSGWAVRLEPGALWVPVSRRQLTEVREALRP